MGWITQEKLDKIESAAKDLEVELLYGEEIKPGDTYLAARNGPAQLLTCESVDPRNWICPKEIAYCFDIWECIKVKI